MSDVKYVEGIVGITDGIVIDLALDEAIELLAILKVCPGQIRLSKQLEGCLFLADQVRTDI